MLVQVLGSTEEGVRSFGAGVPDSHEMSDVGVGYLVKDICKSNKSWVVAGSSVQPHSFIYSIFICEYQSGVINIWFITGVVSH